MAVNYFRIKASDIRDSLAPAYYNNLMTQSYHNKYPYFTLIKKVDIVNTQIKASTKKYIGLENIEGHTNQLTGEITTRTFSSAHNFESNQILFSKLRPYLNKVWYANFDGVCSTEFHILDIKDKLEILPKYLSIYLSSNTVVTHLTNIMGGNTLPRIQRSDLENLQIPLPPMKIQQEIADIMDHAYTEKQRLESEAKELLNSIDSYVMDKLGIEQIEQSKATNKWFTVKASDIRGNRWDPHFSAYKLTRVNISKYPIKSLDDISTVITSGATPKAKGEGYTTKEKGIPFIKSGMIDKLEYINSDDFDYILPQIHNTMLKSSQLKQNDLLIAIVGATIGKIGYYPFDTEANINQAIALVRLKQEYNYKFVMRILESKYGQEQLHGIKRPVARANINLDEIKQIEIPLPPIDIQKKIALECETRRNTAQQNQQLAQDILAKAKADVEKMLFGEGVNQ